SKTAPRTRCGHAGCAHGPRWRKTHCTDRTKPQMAGHGEKMSRKLGVFIVAVIDCPTLIAAAERVGISERTARRWVLREDVRQAIDGTARAMLADAIRRKASVAAQASDVLVRRLRGG